METPERRWFASLTRPGGITSGEGEGGTTELLAADLYDAWQAAEEWAREGDWPAAGCKILLRVRELGGEGEREERVLTIEPHTEGR